MTRTSVTVPNCPKYSRSFSGVVCQESPPTKSLPGAESDDGVDRPARDVDKNIWLRKVLVDKKNSTKKFSCYIYCKLVETFHVASECKTAIYFKKYFDTRAQVFSDRWCHIVFLVVTTDRPRLLQWLVQIEQDRKLNIHLFVYWNSIKMFEEFWFTL